MPPYTKKSLFGLGEYGFFWLNYDKVADATSAQVTDEDMENKGPQPEGYASFSALCERIYKEVGRKAKVELRLGRTPIQSTVIRNLANGKSHAVVILKVFKESEPKDPVYLSLEKSYFGVLAQFSRHEENIIFLSNNQPRRKELMSAENWENLERLLHVSHLDETLQKFEKCQGSMESYNIFLRNCIHFADQFAQRARECDSAIMFKVPGSY